MIAKKYYPLLNNILNVIQYIFFMKKAYTYMQMQINNNVLLCSTVIE